MGMKKLYFLNEEESKRILNLHKEATKKQYLKETIDKKSGEQIPGGISQEAYDKIMAYSREMKRTFQGSLLNSLQQKAINAEFGAGTYDNFWRDNGAAVLRNGGLQAAIGSKAVVTSEKPIEVTTTTTTVKSTGYVNKPLVTKIQQILKDKGVNLGKTGSNKDGVDGVMGNITLNGIVSLLGGGTSTPTTTTTTTITPTGTEAKTPTTSVGGTTLSSNNTPPGR